MKFRFQHEFGNFFKNPINWIVKITILNIMIIGLSYVYFGTGLYIRLWLFNFRFEIQFGLKDYIK